MKAKYFKSEEERSFIMVGENYVVKIYVNSITFLDRSLLFNIYDDDPDFERCTEAEFINACRPVQYKLSDLLSNALIL